MTITSEPPSVEDLRQPLGRQRRTRREMGSWVAGEGTAKASNAALLPHVAKANLASGGLPPLAGNMLRVVQMLQS